jgi:hypothetical protein
VIFAEVIGFFPSEVTIIFAGTLGGPNGERSAGVKVRKNG